MSTFQRAVAVLADVERNPTPSPELRGILTGNGRQGRNRAAPSRHLKANVQEVRHGGQGR